MVFGMNWQRVLRMGLMLGALALVAVSPLTAASSVQTADGRTITVWVAPSGAPGARSGLDPFAPAAGGIAFSIVGPGESRLGIISPTEDSLDDSSPFIVLDPQTGGPVVVWSRSDGVSRKIAYVRFEEGDWRDVHFLTFGRRDHILPRIGVSRGGATLFWAQMNGLYMHAPVDLTAGNLHASPRAIPLGFAPPAGGRPFRGSTIGGKRYEVDAEGGSDVPTVIGRCYSVPEACSGQPPDTRGWQRIGGAPIAPIVVGGQDALWAVAGEAGCSTQVLVIPDLIQPVTRIIEFDARGFRMVLKALIPTSPSDRFAEDLASAHLQNICN